MAKWMAGVAGAAILMMAGAASAAPFDARKPADLAAAIKGAGATGEVKTDSDGKLFFEGKQDDFSFSVEFRDCKDGACEAAYYMASWDMDAPPMKIINLWNDVTYFCPAFVGADGDPFLKMGFRPKATDTRAGVLADYEKWMMCVDEFKGLLSDPDGFESSIKPPGGGSD
ncbi:MAG TPA: YbjN domain-containing protein [Caulobacter sp.]|nr:YbjN domain-containing protein [Caulobacter sp.]